MQTRQSQLTNVRWHQCRPPHRRTVPSLGLPHPPYYITAKMRQCYISSYHSARSLFCVRQCPCEFWCSVSGASNAGYLQSFSARRCPAEYSATVFCLSRYSGVLSLSITPESYSGIGSRSRHASTKLGRSPSLLPPHTMRLFLSVALYAAFIPLLSYIFLFGRIFTPVCHFVYITLFRHFVYAILFKSLRLLRLHLMQASALPSIAAFITFGYHPDSGSTRAADNRVYAWHIYMLSRCFPVKYITFSHISFHFICFFDIFFVSL